MLTIRTLRPASLRWAAAITTLLLLATLATPAHAHGGTSHDSTSPEPTHRGQALGPRTGLHVWLWRTNPAGMFAAYNPNLSCPAA